MENETQQNIPLVQTTPEIPTPDPTPPPTNWSKVILFTTLGLFIIVGLIFAGIQIGKSQVLIQEAIVITPTAMLTQTTANPATSPTQIKNNTLTSIDDTWNLYSNNLLGFSIKIPKMSFEYGGVCINGKLDVAMVPVTTFDDSQGTYITYEYFNEYPINNVCKKTINDLNTIQQRANQWKNGNGNNLIVPSNWHVVIAKVENDNELEGFIKTNYGSGCKIGTKSLSPTGTYDVKILGDGLDLSETKCPINFVYALKYSPELHKAATWGVGQEVVFSSANYKQNYDSEMINSFKFTN